MLGGPQPLRQDPVQERRVQRSVQVHDHHACREDLQGHLLRAEPSQDRDGEGPYDLRQRDGHVRRTERQQREDGVAEAPRHHRECQESLALAGVDLLGAEPVAQALGEPRVEQAELEALDGEHEPKKPRVVAGRQRFPRRCGLLVVVVGHLRGGGGAASPGISPPPARLPTTRFLRTLLHLAPKALVTLSSEIDNVHRRLQCFAAGCRS
mmetsp:Transcript_17037/g.34507  ORF Transcript_17037/g.34507 Transcript_17037/m.34507 type:complete len:209 (-) Transcript_17037:143-769(-)